MPLTIEQQRALAIAQAKRKRAEAEAGPSLRSETDAIIEEAAAAIPGGFASFDAKPADPQRMAAMGYVQDPLAKSGYARPQAPQAPVVDTTNYNNPLRGVTDYAINAVRGLEAPITGITGGQLTQIAKIAPEDPLLASNMAVEFVSPVDDAARAYQGLKQFGAGLIDGDMAKAGEGLQQFSIDGSMTALQVLPGSKTLTGLTGPRNALAPTTLAGAERAAVQASRAPPIRKPAPQVAEPVAQPAPFSASAEPKASGFLANNADRIVGGGVGAFAGSAGDALAAPGDGNEGGGPDIINPVTGAAAGILGPRFAGQAWRAGRRASMAPAARAAYDQRVAYKVLRNSLAPAGITSAEQGIAAKTARFGDKPASVVDLAQGNVGLAANLSRQQGATGEAALARGEQLLGGRAGRLERDIGQAAPGLNPGAITGDVDRMIALAQEQAKPAYDALKQQYPPGSVNSPRLAKIEGIGSHIKAVDEYRAATKANEGRDISDFEYWDLVKRDIDAKEQQLIDGGATLDDIRVRKLEGARAALVKELDDLMPGYAAARELGGEAPKMREAFKQGQKLLDGNFLADEVSNIIREVTGQQLTATQAGVIRNMMKKTQSGRTAMAALMSSDARKKLEAVFGREAAEALQARFAADAAIMTNAQRVSPNVGSVSAQALLGEGGGVQQAAELAQQAVAFKTNPLAAVLGALSRSGAYSQAQRDIMGELLLSDDVAGSLNRIFSNRPPRNPLNVEPPPTPQGPPVNRLGMSGSPEAIGAAGGTAIGMATAPDQNGDGVVDAQERMMGGAGGALTGGIAGRGVRGGMNALAPKPGAPIVKPPTNWPPKPMADPPAPGKIRAYHGSKHEFDQFALTDDTVGTGEGTQSRGYGLYFAERPNLANFYRSIGQNSGSPEDFAGSLLYHEGGDVEKVRAFLKGEIKKAGRTDPTQYKRALDALNKGRATDMSAKQGAFYEVDLDAQADDLFDLDAPLSGQSEIVQSRVADAWRKMKGDAPLDPQTSGYDILMAMGNDKAASEALSANGIKGAQFLDRASREAKSGTRNYVIFDPKNVDVRNKQTPKPPPVMNGFGGEPPNTPNVVSMGGPSDEALIRRIEGGDQSILDMIDNLPRFEAIRIAKLVSSQPVRTKDQAKEAISDVVWQAKVSQYNSQQLDKFFPPPPEPPKPKGGWEPTQETGPKVVPFRASINALTPKPKN